MQEGARTGSVIHSARTVGGSAASPVTVTQTGPPHVVLRRSTGAYTC